MSFKDQLFLDNKKVFLNGKEFAESHNINGYDVLCIIDKNNIVGVDNNAGTYNREGIFLNETTLYISIDDIDIPVEGQTLYLDDVLHLVSKVSQENGILLIGLVKNDE